MATTETGTDSTFQRVLDECVQCFEDGIAREERVQKVNELAEHINDENADVLWQRASMTFDRGVAHQLVRILESNPTHEEHLSAIRAITMISLASPLKKPLLQMGVLPHVIKLIDQDNESKYWAVCCCESLSFTPDNILPMFRAGVVGMVTEVLREGPDEAKGAALGTLTNIADLPEAKKKVFGHGTVQAILSTLSEGNDFACAKGSGTLFTFALDADLRRPLVELGAPDIMMDLWSDPGSDDTARANSAATLFLMCYEQDEEPALHGRPIPTLAGLVSGLMELVQHGTDSLQASKALNRMALYKEAAAKIAESYIHELLFCIRQLDQAGVVNADKRSILLSLLYNLSATVDRRGQSQMVEYGVVDFLEPMMQNRASSDYVLASLCVANLVDPSSSNSELLTSDAAMVEALVAVLHASMKKKFYSGFLWELWAPLQGLANLSYNETNQRLIYQAGALAPMCQVLAQPDLTANLRAKKYAALTVSNLARVVNVGVAAPDLRNALSGLSARCGDETVSHNAQLALFHMAKYRVQTRRKLSCQPISLDSREQNPAKPQVVLAFALEHASRFESIAQQLENNDLYCHLEQSNRSVESIAGLASRCAVMVFGLASACKENESFRMLYRAALSMSKPCIAIRMDDYEPDGWMKQIADGCNLEWASGESHEESFGHLISQLEDLGVLGENQCDLEQDQSQLSMESRLEETQRRLAALELKMKDMVPVSTLTELADELEALEEEVASSEPEEQGWCATM